MAPPRVERVSKPCGRARCPRVITGRPKQLAKRTFCSIDCLALARVESGYQPPHVLTAADRQRGVVKGAKKAAANRHKTAVMKRAAALEHLITLDIVEALSKPQLARIKVLLSRAIYYGYENGRRTGQNDRRERERGAA